MTRPTTEPDWNAPSANVTTPTTAKKNAGWLEERPPLGIFNWFWNLVSSWIAWLATGQAYDGLPAMIADTEAGDAAPVTTADPSWTSGPDFNPWTGATDGYLGDFASNGRYLVYLVVRSAPSAVYGIGCIDLTDGSTAWTSTIDSIGGGFCFDGRYIYIALATAEVVVIDNDTSVANGAVELVDSFATFSTRNARHLACNGNLLVAVEDNGSTGSVEGYTGANDGAPTHVWTYSTDVGSPDNDVHDLCVGGLGYAYLAKGRGGNEGLVILNASTGAAVARVDVDTNDGTSVVVDDEHVYYASDGGGIFAVSLDGAGTPFQILSATVLNGGLAVDDRYLAFKTSDFAVLYRKGFPLDVASRLIGWTPDGAHSDPITRVALDGNLLFVGGWRADTTDNSIVSYTLPARTHVFRRVADTATRPYPSLVVVP